ncbi:MAG TPA: hypothetical protein VIC59_03220 [Gemmatimonadota bacterium]
MIQPACLASSGTHILERRVLRVPGAVLVLACAALPLGALPLGAQVPTAADAAKVDEAAFQHWWPKYEKLMRTLIQNQHAAPGRLKVPPPRPDDLRGELHVGQGFSNPYIPGYTFFGVHTAANVFEGLFLLDPSGNVQVLVNHDNPEDRKPLIEDAYVDRMNRILDDADVSVDDPPEAASLARFFLATFFNFTVHPEDAIGNSVVQDELQRVRVVSSYLEIPQGRRVLQYGAKRTVLVFEAVPPEVRDVIKPPVVSTPERSSWLVQLYTWHPVHGEVKSWNILIRDDQFAFFRDQTVARWKPFHFEGMN